MPGSWQRHRTDECLRERANFWCERCRSLCREGCLDREHGGRGLGAVVHLTPQYARWVGAPRARPTEPLRPSRRGAAYTVFGVCRTTCTDRSNLKNAYSSTLQSPPPTAPTPHSSTPTAQPPTPIHLNPQLVSPLALLHQPSALHVCLDTSCTAYVCVAVE